MYQGWMGLGVSQAAPRVSSRARASGFSGMCPPGPWLLTPPVPVFSSSLSIWENGTLWTTSTSWTLSVSPCGGQGGRWGKTGLTWPLLEMVC